MLLVEKTWTEISLWKKNFFHISCYCKKYTKNFWKYLLYC